MRLEDLTLEALTLAVRYHGGLPASVPNNPNMVIDTAELFMLFLTRDAKKQDNPNRPSDLTSKTLNLKGPGQSVSGPK